jgi:ribosome-binding factor A
LRRGIWNALKAMGFDFTLPGLGKPESSRPKRVAEAIRNELSILLLQRVRDPRLRGVTITLVEVTADIKLARIYYSVARADEAAQAGKGLARAKGFFRSRIAKVLNLRYTPELMFYYDATHEKSERLEEIFRKIADERKSDDDAA